MAPPANRNTKISQVNSATGVMGPTGSGKSFLLATLAAWVWETHHKVTRLYNSDGGGYPAAVQKLMALGIMEVFRMRTRDPGDLGLAFETAQRCAQGWWPRRIKPSSGEVPPGVEMVPPISVRFHGYCPNGHLVHNVFTEAQVAAAKVCGQCKVQVTKANVRVEKVVAATPGFENVGAVCFDGLTATLAWEKLEMGHRAGRMELKGEEGAIGGKVVSGDLKFGGTTRSHVGFVQDRGEELIHLSMGIPNLVVPPVWTMLTHEDVDDRGQSIRGPKISGRAKTDEAGQWFGNMLEAGMEEAANGKLARTLFLSQFYDEQNVKHLIKHRADPGTMPPKLQDPPDTDGENSAAAGSQFNLGVFFDLLDVALQSSVQKGLEQFPDAPGVAEGWVEYGSYGLVAPAGTSSAVAVAPVPQNVVEGKPAPGTAPSAPVAPAKAPATTRGSKKTAATGANAAPPAAVPVAGAPAAPAQDATGATAGPSEAKPADAALTPASTEPTSAPDAPVAVDVEASPEMGGVDTSAGSSPVAQVPPPPVAIPATPAPASAAPGAPKVSAPAAPRPAALAPPSGARPAMAQPAGVRPPTPLNPRPAGMPPATVTGPGVPQPTAVPHAPQAAAAVPRPPAAAPRPPAPSAPRPVGPGTKE